MKKLDGKVAVVTGAAMGMGKCIAGMLMAEGCKVALLDMNPDRLAETRQALSELGTCRDFVCDISDRGAVYETASKIRSEMGRVSILVNNAGIVKAGTLLSLEDEVIEKILDVNLSALFWTCKAFLPDMVDQGQGHIVNMASAGGILAIPNLTAYCASKFGVIGFSDALRQEMAKIRVDVGVTYVCPNTVNTGMFDGARMVAGTSLLSAENVATQVVKAIRRNRAMVAIPGFPIKFITPLTKILMPIRLMDRMNRALGMWTANDTWTGRQTKDKGV